MAPKHGQIMLMNRKTQDLKSHTGSMPLLVDYYMQSHRLTPAQQSVFRHKHGLLYILIIKVKSKKYITVRIVPKTKVLLSRSQVTLSNLGYPLQVFFLPKKSFNFGGPDDGYSRNVSRNKSDIYVFIAISVSIPTMVYYEL